MIIAALRQIKTSLIFLLLFSVLTGLIYPAVVTLIAQILFPFQANGSLLQVNHKPIGSLLIGQYFDTPEYFWGRPSATPHFPYNAANSAGSNMGPSNPQFLSVLNNRMDLLRQKNSMAQPLPKNNPLVPVDLVTASASGLDPEISPLAAYYQIPRIAKVRHLSEKEIQALVNQFIKERTLHLFGEPRINVLELNLALDHIRTSK